MKGVEVIYRSLRLRIRLRIFFAESLDVEYSVTFCACDFIGKRRLCEILLGNLTYRVGFLLFGRGVQWSYFYM